MPGRQRPWYRTGQDVLRRLAPAGRCRKRADRNHAAAARTSDLPAASASRTRARRGPVPLAAPETRAARTSQATTLQAKRPWSRVRSARERARPGTDSRVHALAREVAARTVRIEGGGKAQGRGRPAESGERFCDLRACSCSAAPSSVRSPCRGTRHRGASPRSGLPLRDASAGSRNRSTWARCW